MKEKSKLKPYFVRVDKRGVFVEALSGNVGKSIIYGRMKKGAVLGDHFHKKTDVYIFCVFGQMKYFLTDSGSGKLNQGTLDEDEGVFVPRNTLHRLIFLKPSVFIMTKSKQFDPHDPDIYFNSHKNLTGE